MIDREEGLINAYNEITREGRVTDKLMVTIDHAKELSVFLDCEVSEIKELFEVVNERRS